TPGLDSLVFLLLFVLAWRLLARSSQIGTWMRNDKRNTDRPVIRVLPLRSALRFLLEPIAFTFGFYLLCCGISHTPPFPPAVVSLGGKMLALIAVGCMLSFGVERFSVMGLSALLRIVLVVVLFVGAIYYNQPQVRQLAYFSPTLGLLNLGNPALVGLGGLYQPPLPWIHWIRCCGGIGVPLTLLALALALRRKPQVEIPGAVVVDPTRVGYEVYIEESQAQKKAATKEENPLRERLSAWLQKVWDNAVAVKEVRGRLRGRQDLGVSRFVLIACLVITVGLYQGVPMIPQTIGDGIATALFGQARVPGVQTFADILVCWYLLLLIAAPIAGFSTGKAFALERDKSTLGFLLMTPMSGSGIVLGKAIGILLSSSLILALLLIWTLLMSLGLSVMMGPIVLAIWLLMALTALLIYGKVGMVTLAVATLMVRWTLSQTAWAWIMMVAIQLLIFGGQFAWRYLMDFFQSAGLSGPMLWAILLGFCSGMIVISYLITVWAVQSMRKRDLIFGASKREN
ncbi:MAG TPA: hypothetical protein VKU00_26805, partial [Chthonomonadaceae bacterium]|nr:hypothetical protein [Chthonomonadaceae bacterium]